MPDFFFKQSVALEEKEMSAQTGTTDRWKDRQIDDFFMTFLDSLVTIFTLVSPSSAFISLTLSN